MQKRPKFKIELKTPDKVVEIMGWVLLIAIWALILTNYSKLPEIIATHFNGAGQADGYGEKSTILTLPIIATLLFMGLTILNRFPHIFNYPVSITKDNALRQYTNATRMVRVMKLVIVLVFLLIAFKSIQNATGQTQGLGMWFVPIILGVVFIPLIYFVIKSFNQER